MNIQRRLGRGLEALLGQPDGPGAATQQHATIPQTESAVAGPTQLSVYEIDSNPYQPRKNSTTPKSNRWPKAFASTASFRR